MPNFETFSFEDYRFDPLKKQALFTYALDKTRFTETLTFDFTFEKYDEEMLQRALHGLWVMMGISYFKAACPKNIVFQQEPLTKDQANFFNHVWTQGLGEFAHENNMSPRGLVDFPYEEKAKESFQSSTTEYKGSLLPLGGGKDSLTSATLLKGMSDIHTITIGHGDLMQKQSEKLGLPHLTMQRTIAPELIELNKQGSLNGHVPISALWAFMLIVAAILTNKKHVILSNESSANEPNTVIDGIDINHQYSKSLDFEERFQKYVAQYISKEITYFSLLRPFCELKIGELFAQHCWPNFKHEFISCNKNFTLNHQGTCTWCGNCPKCAFVFLILSPFVDRDELIEVFGENLFAKPELHDTFLELFGLKDIKPFECVGMVDECLAAVQLGLQTDRLTGIQKWPELETFNIPEVSFEKDTWYDHRVPEDFITFLSHSGLPRITP